MKEALPVRIFDHLIKVTSRSQDNDLEEIEHLLEEMIAEVTPRRDFQKSLGERLAQVDSASVEVEGTKKPAIVVNAPPPAYDYSLLAVGIVGGLVLILMAVRLLINLQRRKNSTQT